MNTNLTVYKSNAVIEAGYKLSLNEQRTVLACIGQINSREDLLKTDKFELFAKDFAKFFDISEDRAYGELKEIAKNLYQRSMTIYNPDPSRPKLTKLETRWISSIGYMPDEGKIILCFAQDILPYLCGLKGSFTKYELRHIGNMNCVYAVRLYELLMQWRTTGKREIEIAWLKKRFQIEELYPDMADFKKRVINPAVKDINEYSNFSVEWEQRKTGRKVTHLIFTFAEKIPPESEQSQAIEPPAEPTTAVIKLTAEQQKCFEWAKNQDFWKKHTRSKQGFLKCFNNETAGKLSLKSQWLDTLPKAAQPKKEKSAAALKKEAELERVNLQNELANLKKLYKGTPSDAIAGQILRLEEKLSNYKP